MTVTPLERKLLVLGTLLRRRTQNRDLRDLLLTQNTGGLDDPRVIPLDQNDMTVDRAGATRQLLEKSHADLRGYCNRLSHTTRKPPRENRLLNADAGRRRRFSVAHLSWQSRGMRMAYVLTYTAWIRRALTKT